MKYISIILAVLLLASSAAVVSASERTASQMGDYNLNGYLDFSDLVGFFWELTCTPMPYRADLDLNANGHLDFDDLVCLWGLMAW